MPVRLTELSINESAFDVNLNPIRASLSIGMKVLTVSDLPAGHRARSCTSRTSPRRNGSPGRRWRAVSGARADRRRHRTAAATGRA
ncbi:hypothetical protein NKH77_40120 [Streptomyces sp. M19]